MFGGGKDSATHYEMVFVPSSLNTNVKTREKNSYKYQLTLQRGECGRLKQEGKMQ